MADAVDTDELWGRVPGARPPIRPWTPVLFFLVIGALLTVVVLQLVRLPGPLDEHTLADQRNGLLLQGPVLPQQVHGIVFGDRPVVLLFVRSVPQSADVARWSAELPRSAEVRVIVQSAEGALRGGLVRDRERELAQAVRLPRARDGGPGIGYAVIDSRRTVRYATLDPSWRGNGFEVATIAGAIT